MEIQYNYGSHSIHMRGIKRVRLHTSELWKGEINHVGQSRPEGKRKNGAFR